MPDLAKQFTKEEIIKAIQYIDEFNPELEKSTVHDLIYKGKTYPPKEVVRWAARLKNLPNWETYTLSGGENTNAPLRKLGFEIQNKKVPAKINSLIEAYKNAVRKNKLKEEIYKWELIEQYKNRPDFNNPNFLEEITSIEYSNLIYNIAKATIRHISREFQEEYKEALKYLFDESIELEHRIQEFTERIEKMYRILVPDKKYSSHHDERTIATLLTYKYPSKYTFYMSSIYEDYCQFLGIPHEKKKNKKYIHYLTLVKGMIENYLKNDTELQELVNSCKSENCFKDENLMILAQDIIYFLRKDEEGKLTMEQLYVDYLDWYIENFENECSEKIKLGVINFLNSLERTGKLSKEELNNYNSNVLKIVLSEIPNTSINNLQTFERFIKELLAEESDTMKPQPLNQILYGPPGTGKTYHTITKSIQIINPDFDLTQNREEIKKEFNRLVENGQVQFVTFHQSMNYEDFVEGIKPYVEEVEEDEKPQVLYEVQDGIFKEITLKASLKEVHKTQSINWDKADYYKLSLGGKQRPHIHNYCIENNFISIGYGGSKDLSVLKHITNWEDFKVEFAKINPKEVEQTKYHIQAAYTFLKMKKGDVIVVSRGNLIIDAIGVVEGDYFFDENQSIEYVHFRPVKWLATNMNYKPDYFLNKVKISQMTIYEFYKRNIKVEAFSEMFGGEEIEKVEPKKHVLIIDEINRGNVSQIFGELITLIEEDKRIGKSEELYVTLPYSKEKFGVPSNLYIIGTMNTADRSVEAIDTALRRRFSFEEMPPRYDLEGLQYTINGIQAWEILKTINARIESLIDRDHAIGHAYFLNKNEEAIMDSFYRNIIPLLQEYFFGDYGKIGLVLGKGFVRVKDETVKFAHFNYEGFDFDPKETYEIIDYRKDNDQQGFLKAISMLMNRSVEE